MVKRNEHLWLPACQLFNFLFNSSVWWYSLVKNDKDGVKYVDYIKTGETQDKDLLCSVYAKVCCKYMGQWEPQAGSWEKSTLDKSCSPDRKFSLVIFIRFQLTIWLFTWKQLGREDSFLLSVFSFDLAIYSSFCSFIQQKFA